ncbi:hypothetical protein DPMN_037992 [Dreissena polymorpha]|uniref:Organic solute transporter subunit alpha n=2 Tax=Dreissena polymorpha TaxID=45954 RepID=A0A9D4RN99_DREPO|nr:hypothetical protein DPMN_037992 [Dreissena polymorpha]
MTANCSNDYPDTSVLFSELRADFPRTVLMAVACALVLACLAIFLEELVFLHQVYHGNGVKVRKVATILGLYPVTIVMALMALMAPKISFLLDLFASCYLSVCFFTLVSLIIDTFGNEARMIEHFRGMTIQTSLPPCCCCCCCILRPRLLTEQSLFFFKLCALQVAVIRPVLSIIAAALWFDGIYKQDLTSPASAYLYITTITVISALFSMYGTIVICRATSPFLKSYRIGVKFFSLQLLLITSTIQSLVFNILATHGIPGCIASRGPAVRDNAFNHFALIVETFLLCLLARKGYRMDETILPGPTPREDLPGCDNEFGHAHWREDNYGAIENNTIEIESTKLN